MGDGGAVITDDAELAAIVRSLRHHGSAPDDANRHVRAGLDGAARQPPGGAAAAQARRTSTGGTRERREAAERYREALDDLPASRCRRPTRSAGCQVFHLFVIELDERDRVLARAARGRHRRRGPLPDARPPPAARGARWASPARSPPPSAWRSAALTLPVFPGITAAEVDRVAKALRTAVAAAAV